MFGVLIIGRLGSNLENKSSDLKKKKNFIRQNQKGFTFVELLVAILLLALVSVTVAGFLSVINQNYRHNQMKQQHRQIFLYTMIPFIIELHG